MSVRPPVCLSVCLQIMLVSAVETATINTALLLSELQRLRVVFHHKSNMYLQGIISLNGNVKCDGGMEK